MALTREGETLLREAALLAQLAEHLTERPIKRSPHAATVRPRRRSLYSIYSAAGWARGDRRGAPATGGAERGATGLEGQGWPRDPSTRTEARAYPRGRRGRTVPSGARAAAVPRGGGRGAR